MLFVPLPLDGDQHQGVVQRAWDREGLNWSANRWRIIGDCICSWISVLKEAFGEKRSTSEYVLVGFVSCWIDGYTTLKLEEGCGK